MILWFIGVVLSGLVVGALGRLALPGPDPMSVPATIGVGVGGSLVGSLLTLVVLGRGAGLIASVLGAVAILLIVRRMRGGATGAGR